MRTFHVTLRDHGDQLVDADAYAQEGPMTTFFELGEGRQVVDCWAHRIASIRTADILLIRRAGDQGSKRRTVMGSNTSGSGCTTTSLTGRAVSRTPATPSQTPS